MNQILKILVCFLRTREGVNAFLSYENGNYAVLLKTVADQSFKGVFEGKIDQRELLERFQFLKEFFEFLRLLLLGDTDSVDELLPGVDKFVNKIVSRFCDNLEREND